MCNLFDETELRWDEDILKDIFNERDMRLIQQIPLLMNSRDDMWCWSFEDKGEFSVRSCYRSLRGEFMSVVIKIFGENYGDYNSREKL